MHVDVRVVYSTRKKMVHKSPVSSLCIFYDSTVPNGNVSYVANCQQTAFGQYVRYSLYLSGLWRRFGGIPVFGLYKKRTARNRRSRYDRRLRSYAHVLSYSYAHIK